MTSSSNDRIIDSPVPLPVCQPVPASANALIAASQCASQVDNLIMFSNFSYGVAVLRRDEKFIYVRTAYVTPTDFRCEF